jgi:hypothetical protein
MGAIGGIGAMRGTVMTPGPKLKPRPRDSLDAATVLTFTVRVRPSL